MRDIKKLVLGVAFLAATTAAAWAVPAHPGWTAVTQPDGTQVLLQLHGDEFFHYLTDQSGQVMVKGEDGFYRPQGTIDQQTFLRKRKAAKARRDMKSPKKELRYNPAPKGLVLVVEFPDNRCQAASTSESLSEMCNGENYTYGGAYGSAKKYFEAQSNNTYSPIFDVYGPILLPHNTAYYGENDETDVDKRVPEAVIDGCLIADTMYNVDFSQYDSDGDGFVDFIYLLYAGHGENFTGADENLIWPHQWNVVGYTGFDDAVAIDNVILATYACSAELNGMYGSERCGIGTLCHEFSHVLGLPDYYDTEYGTNYYSGMVPGSWDIMSAGSHNMDGKSPCNYTVHEKWQFGWATPTLLNHTQDVTMAASQDYYYIALDGTEKTPSSTDTIYLLENRQKKSWDRSISGHGMLIWRFVYDEEKWNDNKPNNTAGEPNYIFIPADGSYEAGDSGDPYPGTRRVTSFEVPNTVYTLNNIAESGSTVSFRFVEGCDGYVVAMNAPHVKVTEPQVGHCYEANAQYVATLEAKKNYEILGVVVTMGGQLLTDSVDYTYLSGVLTIPALTGDVTIDVISEKIEFAHDSCMSFHWEPDSALIGTDVVLDGLNWTLDITGSSYRSYDNQAQGRGAQFGSRSSSPGNVTFHTDEMSRCLITSVEVTTCVASEGGLMEVVVDDETIGTANLSAESTTYEYTNPEEWHGAVDIRFRNMQKALFIKKIVIHFADEPEDPDGIELVVHARPQGEITGIYSITGQSMGCEVECLPRGLYLVTHTDGTEKIMIK